MTSKRKQNKERQAIIAVPFGPHGDYKKLVRIVVMGDGSVGVLVPYHPATSGRLMRIRMPPTQFTGGIIPNGAPAAVEASEVIDVPVKLSLHPSGFVQFSAAGPHRVESGVTRPFLIPKAFGLHSQPFTDPIESGPTFGVQFRQIGECESVDGNEQVRIIRFAEHEIFERDDHDGASRHIYIVEGFILPTSLRPWVKPTSGGRVLDYRYSPLRPDWIVRFRTIDLPNPFAFLGVVISRYHEPVTGQKGYGIFSPRDITHQFEVAGHFPPDAWETDEEVGEGHG